MLSKEKALKLAVMTLTVIACIDLLRGFMHTYNIWWASENIAHMSQTADTMLLMSTFGISNWLTGFIYLLLVVKAKEMVPYVLLMIPSAYLLGIISNKITEVAAMQTTTQWNGQYMMYVYLAAVTLVGINYFLASYREKKMRKEIG